MDMQTMLDRWIEFCKTMNIDSPIKYFEKIKTSYSETERYYHTFKEHIAQGLEDFEEVKHICENSSLVYFSWLSHDVIYDPRRSNNEEESASFAYALAIKMNLSYKFASSVNNLILITKHTKKPDTIDEKLLIDIDLSIFGQPKEIFDEYEKNIRKEYSWVEPEKFREARTNILKQFLNRKHIYSTDFFKQKYEEKARKNLQRSLEKLTL